MPTFRRVEGEKPAEVTRAVGRSGRSAAPLNGGDLGFETKLWDAADLMRGNLESAEYKHVVLGLIFLKYISDAFEEKRSALLGEVGAGPEDRDEYQADFRVTDASNLVAERV